MATFYRIKVGRYGLPDQYFEGMQLGGRPIPSDVPFLDPEAVRLFSELTFGTPWCTSDQKLAVEMVDAMKSMGRDAVVESFEVGDFERAVAEQREREMETE